MLLPEMNKKKIHTFFFLVLFVCCSLSNSATAGNPKTDSLELRLKESREDTNKVNLLISLTGKLDCSDTSKSLGYANLAYNLSQKLNWQKGMAKSKMATAYLYDGECIKRPLVAIRYYTQSAEIAKAIGDSVDQASAYNYIGQSYSRLNVYDSALYYYKLGLGYESDVENKICILGNSGDVYNKLSDYSNALTSYADALKMVEELLASDKKNKKYMLSKIALLLTMGDIHVSNSQYDKALENYTSALKMTANVDMEGMRMLALTDIGKVNKLKKDYAAALKNFEEGLMLSKKLGKRQERAMILDQMSNLYLETGDVLKALDYAKQSLNDAEGDNNQLPITYTTLARVYTASKQYEDAVSYLQKSLAITEKTHARNDEKDAWEGLYYAYKGLKQSDKALEAFENFRQLKDSLQNVEKAKEYVRIDMKAAFDRQHLADSLSQAELFHTRMQRQRTITYSGFAALAGVVLLSFFIYRNYSQQKKANKIISKANETAKKEKQISDRLLRNILPDEVAEELKTAGAVQARQYSEVTVLFTDFVNFTEAGERMSPQALVAELDACFIEFDEIISKYNIEKIKTVGDAYLAVAGLPYPDKQHAQNMVKAAIEIRNFMVERKKRLGDQTFGVRIGINSGSVVAGIVGVKKFAYDIWGDTVNIAARMEQGSQEGKINISHSTYELVKDMANCTPRGDIDVKGKRKMDMYFVDSLLHPAAATSTTG